MNKVESIWQHKKSERVAFVTDKGVFVLLARKGHTVDSLKKIVESGDAFLPSEGLNPAALPKEWEEHKAVKPAVAAPVVHAAQAAKLGVLGGGKIVADVKFSACRYAAGFYFFKVKGSNECYWLPRRMAEGVDAMDILSENVRRRASRGSWAEYKKRYNDNAAMPWKVVSLAGKQ